MRRCGCPEESLVIRRQRLRNIARLNIVDDGSVVNIGVVFHIMFANNNQAQYQADADYVITELNKDFAKQASTFNTVGPYTNLSYQTTYQNYIGRAANCKIVFFKQQVLYHPVGLQSSDNISLLDSNVKAASPAISPQTNLNIWVADLNSGLLGYAQFPWELSSRPNTDGVLIAKGTFGRGATYTNYDLGKTLTHEVGHWFGLYHTFQSTFAYEGGNIDYMDGTAAQEIQEAKGDCVVDTPPQGNPTYGNPLNTPNTWPTSRASDETSSYQHMYMNFMDYSDDIALMMFTNDQSIKMRLMLYMYRPALVPGFTTSAPAPAPTPAPTPAPAVIWHHGFEDSDPGRWRLTTVHNKSDAKIVSGYAVEGTKCLALRKKATAEIQVNLTGVTKAKLRLQVRNAATGTSIQAQSKKRVWKTTTIQSNGNTYKTIEIPLQGPFGPNYAIRIRAPNTDQYSYFDDVNIV